MDFRVALLLAVAVCFVASAVDATTRMTLNCVGCGSEDYSPSPAPSPETEPIEGEETVFSVMDYEAVGNEETDDGELSWVVFRHLRGLTIRGADGASRDGQGEEAWNGHRHCLHKSKCGSLPRNFYLSSATEQSLRFKNVSNGNIGNIALLNSKGFHMSFSECQNITIHDMSITAPWDSPNTDGIHVSDSPNIRITSSTIGTGDDCVSIGPGSFNVSVSKVTCGPGHGISVHAFAASEVLEGINTGRMWLGSVPSLVQLSKICFMNIRGTSRTTPVTLKCSSRVPCVNVTVFDIDVTNIKAKKHKQSMWNLQGGIVGLEIDTNGPEQPWWNLENWSWSKE
ncbi:putative galacturan 1,4-alpha-galacturonidase SALK6 [Drosera capensis]